MLPLAPFFDELIKIADQVYKKTSFHGIPVHIDRPKGFVKELDASATGRTHILYKHDYGFIPGVMDHDGEELDVLMGPHPKHPEVFVVEKQKRPGQFDEHKVLLGFKNLEAARETASHYWSYPGDIYPLHVNEFKTAIADGKLKRREVKQSFLSWL